MSEERGGEEMANDYGNSEAPIVGPVTTEERRAALEGVTERRDAATMLAQEPVAPPPEELSKFQSFVAAREYANATFLVQPGKPVPLPPAFAAGSSIQPLARREGDIWAKFAGGVLVTDNPVVVKWCEEHPKVCRSSDDPMTKGWATVKDMQARLSNRDALVDASQLDADETFPPGMAETLLAQAQAAKRGSAGVDAVEGAEAAREATEKRVGERADEPGRLAP